VAAGQNKRKDISTVEGKNDSIPTQKPVKAKNLPKKDSVYENPQGAANTEKRKTPVRSHLLRPLLWGTVFGAAGLFSAALVVHDSLGEGWNLLPYGAGAAAFLLALIVRRVVSVLLVGVSGWCGAAMGALIVLLSHPLAWTLLTIHHALLGVESSLGDAPLRVTDVPWGSLILAFWSLALTGWWTVPLGSGLGVLLVRFERAKFPAE
jgi:hypothetical protein